MNRQVIIYVENYEWNSNFVFSITADGNTVSANLGPIQNKHEHSFTCWKNNALTCRMSMNIIEKLAISKPVIYVPIITVRENSGYIQRNTFSTPESGAYGVRGTKWNK